MQEITDANESERAEAEALAELDAQSAVIVNREDDEEAAANDERILRFTQDDGSEVK